MSAAVPPKRAYKSPMREQQAAATRAAIVAAAVELFVRDGWAATGMRNVAAAAGVSVETIYSHFRSKADLLMAGIDIAVVGDAEPVALADRPEFAALAQGTATERAAAGARLQTHIQRRTVALHLVLRQAASADAALGARMRADEERRRRTVEQACALVAGRPVTREERDGLWALLSVEVWHLLIDLSGWSEEQYQAWLEKAILRLLDLDGSSRRKGRA